MNNNINKVKLVKDLIGLIVSANVIHSYYQCDRDKFQRLLDEFCLSPVQIVEFIIDNKDTFEYFGISAGVIDPNVYSVYYNDFKVYLN